MSTLAYAELTNKRDAAIPSTSESSSPPGVKTYVDALAALVPAELLTLHALILSVTTRVTGATTTIKDVETLKWAFWGLIVLGSALYAVPRFLEHKWNNLDWIRSLIPPFAFAGWTMLQRATAFDAAFPKLAESPRTVAALFLAVIIGGLATSLAYKADQKKPSQRPPAEAEAWNFGAQSGP